MALRRGGARPGGAARHGPDDAALGAPGNPAESEAAAVVVATAVFRRTGHRYRDRTYRYVLADLGHPLEKLRMAAAVLGLRVQPMAAFEESRVAATLGVDEAEEDVLALVGLQTASTGGPEALRPPLPAPHRWLTPLCPPRVPRRSA